MAFLSEVIAASEPSELSPFAECMVIAALHCRCIAHRQQALSAGQSLSGPEAREFWTRLEWLAGAVERRAKLFEPTAANLVDRDPMLMFNCMLAHSTVIYQNSTVERIPWQTAEHRRMAAAYEQRASYAASEVVRLSRTIPNLSCFKVRPLIPLILCTLLSLPGLSGNTHTLPLLSGGHILIDVSRPTPFLPTTLASTVTFLTTRSKGLNLENMSAEEKDVGQLLSVLEDLKDVNNLADELAYALKADGSMWEIACTTSTESRNS